MNFGWANQGLLEAAKKAGAQFCNIRVEDNRIGLQYQMNPPKHIKTIIEFFKFDTYGRLITFNGSRTYVAVDPKGKSGLIVRKDKVFEMDNVIHTPQLIYLSNILCEDLDNHHYDLPESYYSISDKMSKAKHKDDSEFLRIIWEEKFGKQFLTPYDVDSFLKHSIKSGRICKSAENINFAFTDYGYYRMPEMKIASSGGDLQLVEIPTPYELDEALKQTYKNLHHHTWGGVQIKNPIKNLLINPNP